MTNIVKIKNLKFIYKIKNLLIFFLISLIILYEFKKNIYTVL